MTTRSACMCCNLLRMETYIITIIQVDEFQELGQDILSHLQLCKIFFKGRETGKY